MPLDSKKNGTDAPYPGLRFYQKELAGIFAGRDREIAACAGVLMQSSILILHGRTGCGKSSFLRAGVKPKLERSRVGARFQGKPTEFEVIRSTRFPLRELAKKLVETSEDILERLDSKGQERTSESLLGRLMKHINDEDVVALEKLLNKVPKDKRIQHLCTYEGKEILRMVELVGKLVRHAPIFVIDQAEEVFTLENVEETHESDSAQEKGTDSFDLSEPLLDPETETQNYFRFLKDFVEAKPRCRLVISLRTEYKGLFDDQISSDGQGYIGKGLGGFYLSELGRKGLEEAILRPTLTKDQWEQAKFTERPEGDHIDYGFDISPAVVETLVNELESEKVPAGGILPTLQVSCLRLWHMAKASRKRSQRRFTVSMNHFRQLGDIQGQVEAYLEQSLEEACAKVEGWPEEKRNESLADDWHKILGRQLVRVEADGRAVTQSQTLDNLVIAAQGLIENASDSVIKNLIEHISEDHVGILRKDERNGELYWTLGHDALALALNKWRILFDQRDRSMMMMRMGMSSVGNPSGYSEDDLYPYDADKPHQITVYVQHDFGWDHQLPFFAMQRGFAERLGIRIEVDDELKAKSLHNNRGQVDWPALRQKLVETEEELRKKREVGKAASYVMISNDWNSFPGSKDYRKNPQRADDLCGFKILDHIKNWSDVAVTDIFFGNGLIGENDDWAEKTKAIDGADSNGHNIATMIAHIRKALEEIRERSGRVKCHSQTGLQFLEFAAEIAEDEQFKEYIEKSGRVEVVKNSDYQAHDKLLDWLLSDNDEEAKYIVGSAQSRALALQAGLSIYFGTNHLATIARDAAAKGVNRGSKEDRLAHVSNVAEEIQRSVVHTLWQVGIPAAKWNIGSNRPVVLRLASLGYFSSEYIRTNADQYVRYLHNFMNDVFRNISGDDKAGKDMRISRAALRQSWQNCFSINKFDEVGPETYDPDSLYAYVPQHGKFGSSSVAAEIYAELMTLRARTMEHFTTLSESIAWLNAQIDFGTRSKADKAKNQKEATKNLWEAFKYREAAWRNYRILNFYDAERFMAHAVHIVQREIERTARR